MNASPSQQPRPTAKKPRQPQVRHYRKTSAIIDDRPDGKPIIFGYGRHLTKREKERVQQRIAYGVLAAVALVCVVVVLVTVIYNAFIYPNQTVASVNGHGISRSDRTVMTNYYTAAEAQAAAQGAQTASLGDAQTLAVEQLQKSLLTKLAAQEKLHITASLDDARALLTSNLKGNTSSFDAALKQYGISKDDYLRLVEEPRVLEQKVGVYLTRNEPKTAAQWHYARISLKTQAAADAALKQLLAGGNFAAIAKKQSQDTQTASSGGDMGWERVTDPGDPLLASTFLPELQKMQKTHTKYKVVKYSATVWYLIEFLGYDAKHPLSSTQQQTDQVTAFNDWIKPIQASAVFDPPLPASATTSTSGGSSVVSPSSSSGSGSNSTSGSL